MCALRQARILSSETDNTIEQNQKTEVKIHVDQPNTKNEQHQQGIAYAPGINAQSSGYIPIQPSYPTVNPTVTPANFTSTPVMEGSQYPSSVATNNQLHTDDENKDFIINELQVKNEFLELLLTTMSSYPLVISKCIICSQSTLMRMIKLLTGGDKVEFILSDDIGCGCCGGNCDVLYISKILITKNNVTSEMKYTYNEAYSQFIKYGVSLKIIVA